MTGLLQEHLSRQWESLQNLAHAHAGSPPLMEVSATDWLDPTTRVGPVRIELALRTVAIVDMEVRGRSLKRDFGSDAEAFVRTLDPDPLDWEPVFAEPLEDPAQPPLRLRLFLPTDPNRPTSPEVYFVDRVWHPNIRWDNGLVCYGDKQAWAQPDRSLADLVRRLFTMTAFADRGAVHPDEAHALNKAALRWYRDTMHEMPELFPLSRRIPT
ncbi:MAG: hypothetical protein VKO21_00820 [Candidatus Sericytochromatia bacterium]|nr:hypothetical protein [Candidatus Sericytochromatia bacterium]